MCQPCCCERSEKGIVVEQAQIVTLERGRKNQRGNTPGRNWAKERVLRGKPLFTKTEKKWQTVSLIMTRKENMEWGKENANEHKWDEKLPW